MNFTRRMWKLEEHYESKITDDVIEMMQEEYGDDYLQFSEELINDFRLFVEENPFGFFSMGLKNLIQYWEDENGY
jgi:hypothetical protein